MLILIPHEVGNDYRLQMVLDDVQKHCEIEHIPEFISAKPAETMPYKKYFIQLESEGFIVSEADFEFGLIRVRYHIDTERKIVFASKIKKRRQHAPD